MNTSAETRTPLPLLLKSKKALIDALHITPAMRVLDVGFVGQAVQETDSSWPHALLRKKTDNLYGVDLEFDESAFPAPNYLRASAEDFSFPTTFDLIFAGDLIEHLSNPGLFLTCCKKHLAPGGRLVITTPNAFNFFALVEKITHNEPNVNPDHTLYFNTPVLSVLLRKNGFTSFSRTYIYTLGTLWEGGFKRKVLASIYTALSWVTPKFSETLVMTVFAD